MLTSSSLAHSFLRPFPFLSPLSSLLSPALALRRPPFTFQRMCDLLLEPKRYCKSLNKFLLSFSKVRASSPEEGGGGGG